MGRFQRANNTKTSSDMDIDPQPSSWNSLCPSYVDARRNKLRQEEPNAPVIGSPPPAGPPRVPWDANCSTAVPNTASSSKPSGEKKAAADASDLSTRVQDIRIQSPQPIIICETVEDMKTTLNGEEPACSLSLAVPPVDISNEKKRPPLSSPY